MDTNRCVYGGDGEHEIIHQVGQMEVVRELLLSWSRQKHLAPLNIIQFLAFIMITTNIWVMLYRSHIIFTTPQWGKQPGIKKLRFCKFKKLSHSQIARYLNASLYDLLQQSLNFILSQVVSITLPHNADLIFQVLESITRALRWFSRHQEW